MLLVLKLVYLLLISEINVAMGGGIIEFDFGGMILQNSHYTDMP